MDPILRCSECHTLFLPVHIDLEVDGSGTEFRFCPACGAYEDVLEECPPHFEIAWFWELISCAFSTRERVTLKTIADTRMDFPS